MHTYIFCKISYFRFERPITIWFSVDISVCVFLFCWFRRKIRRRRYEKKVMHQIDTYCLLTEAHTSNAPHSKRWKWFVCILFYSSSARFVLSSGWFWCWYSNFVYLHGHRMQMVFVLFWFRTNCNKTNMIIEYTMWNIYRPIRSYTDLPRLCIWLYCLYNFILIYWRLCVLLRLVFE